jgi:G:T-mismatch repair DNA endonuclease (very short patch repair protein)
MNSLRLAAAHKCLWAVGSCITAQLRKQDLKYQKRDLARAVTFDLTNYLQLSELGFGRKWKQKELTEW